MSTANLTREETADRARSISLQLVVLELDLADARDPDRTGFPTASTLRFSSTEPETWLDFIGERVDRVTVNGADVPVEHDGARIRIVGLATDGAVNVVRVEAVGAYSRSGEGLHRFVDPVDGETYLYTQYEPADARRVMACFEQPDLKAEYDVVVRAPAAWRVLSNGRELEAVDDDETGIRTTRFERTRRISTYITAIAAGPYHRVDGVWRDERRAGEPGAEVELGVLCRASLARHLDAEEILDVTRRCLSFFTELFDSPYPWGKYDQILVPEYNLGAMENPGLVTFTEAYVFRGAATEAQREARANTIAHEMAHMWFGDLVTMRWWDDLWLKESFADFCGAFALSRATRFADAWVPFAIRRKAWAYEQDQLPTTHPIVADIPDLESAKLNFDGITYAKGASVVKQLVAFVGEDAFVRGVRAYFAAHAYGNTTLEDLLVELERASGRDVRAWSRAWLETSGLTTIALERTDAGLELVQDPPRPHRLDVEGLRYDGQGRLVPAWRREADLSEERTALAPAGGVGAKRAPSADGESAGGAAVGGASAVASPEADAAPRADLDAEAVIVNAGDLAYAKTRLDDRSLGALEAGLSTIDDALTRALAWSSLWNATRDGELDPRRFLRIVRRHAPAETHPALLTTTLANALFAVRHYVAASGRGGAVQRWLETTWAAARAAARAAAPGSDAQLVWMRAFAAAAPLGLDDERTADVRALLDGRLELAGLALDPDLRWNLVTALIATGRGEATDADAELTRDDTASGRTAHLAALAARPDERVRAEAWRRVWDDRSLSNDHLDALIQGVRTGDRRELVAAFDDEYFARIEDAWRERSIEIARRIVVGLFPASASIELVDAWLEARPDAPRALRRLVVERRDHLARDLRVRAAWSGEAGEA